MSHVIIKNLAQIQKIRESGKYLTELLQILAAAVKPGMMTMELESIATAYINRNNVIGAFKGFGKYPTNLCTSINDCLVHGVPDRTILREGDLLKLDCGITFRGGISDAAVSVIVGGAEHNPAGDHLIHVTKQILDESLQYVHPDCFLSDFGTFVQKMAHQHHFSVIENLTGHGVGTKVHEDPSVYNYPHKDSHRFRFKKNMTLAIEPILAFRSKKYIEHKGNKFNLYTEFGDQGAQREYTVAVTDNGPEILAGVR